MLNVWTGIGRLTDAVELRHTNSGVAVCNFTLAVERRRREGQEEPDVDWVGVVAYKRLAVTCSEHLVKGQMVAVSGPIRTRTYEAKDGGKRKAVEIVAREVQFLQKPKAAQADKPGQPEDIQDIGDIDEDLPF